MNKALLTLCIVFSMVFSVVIGYLLGIRKNFQNVLIEKNQLIMEMDKSCYEQFQNNMDKTLYLKLNYEGKTE